MLQGENILQGEKNVPQKTKAPEEEVSNDNMLQGKKYVTRWKKCTAEDKGARGGSEQRQDVFAHTLQLLGHMWVWGMRMCQKRPIHMAKEAYSYDKIDLFIWQKRPIEISI